MQITPPASARSSAVPYPLSNDITFDSETVDTSAEDLELDYRVFTRGGERMLEMTILNRAAADGRSSRTGGVTLRAWADGDEEAETFRYVFPQEIVDGRTHTITLPVAWLAGAADPAEVTVESAAGVPVEVSVTVETDGTVSKPATEQTLTERLAEYLGEIAFTEGAEVVYNRVLALVMGLPGVTDCSGLTVNGGTANVPLDATQLPMLGTVTVNGIEEEAADDGA